MIQGSNKNKNKSEIRSCKDCVKLKDECEDTQYWGTEGFKFFLQAISCKYYKKLKRID